MRLFLLYHSEKPNTEEILKVSQEIGDNLSLILNRPIFLPYIGMTNLQNALNIAYNNRDTQSISRALLGEIPIDMILASYRKL